MAQADAQSRMMQAQSEVEIAYKKASVDEFLAGQKAQVDAQKLQLEQQKIQLETARIQAETAVKVDSTEAKREAKRVEQLIDLQRLELENMAVRMKEGEKLLEERRLNQEQELEKIRLAMQTQQQMVTEVTTPKTEQQPIVINNIIPKTSKKIGKMETDEEGNCINLDPNYAVDIMWFKEIPQSFNEYEVFPDPCGVHTFAGCEDLYKERYCEFFPEYCNPVIDETTDNL